MLVNVWSYKVKGNGKRDGGRRVSSPWLPISVVPGTMIAAICAR